MVGPLEALYSKHNIDILVAGVIEGTKEGGSGGEGGEGGGARQMTTEDSARWRHHTRRAPHDVRYDVGRVT